VSKKKTTVKTTKTTSSISILEFVLSVESFGRQLDGSERAGTAYVERDVPCDVAEACATLESARAKAKTVSSGL